MILKDDNAAIDYIKSSQKESPFFKIAREQSKELFALVEGDKFHEELIKKIEHLESGEKAKARKKYSRSIVDMYERLFQPITNVFSATGSSKKYAIQSEKDKSEFLKRITRIRDNRSIEKWVENQYMPLYHTDPNGVVFMEYQTEGDINATWPTYKSINKIRNYILKGQLLDLILFEPKDIEGGSKLWRIVDDVKDRRIIQTGETFVVDDTKSFDHPFGTVPGFVISDILKVGSVIRVTPIDKIVELTKEYARDQSIKTIYKFLNGFPIHWKYVTQCKPCTGTGKSGEGKCTECDGHGFYKKKDVTDHVTLPVPNKDQQKIAPEIAGFISPDLETWKKYDDELQLLEALAHKTHWGSLITFEPTNGGKTATEIVVSNVQPTINKLNKYADTAEWVEKQITEFAANFYIQSKDKKQNIASISLGRRYIIESPDAILNKYNEAREKGANNVILDRLFNEYLTSKYKNDMEWLRIHLLKSQTEPYLHLTIEQVNTIFGPEEAKKKVLFSDWWASLTMEEIIAKEKTLSDEFDKWLQTKGVIES